MKSLSLKVMALLMAALVLSASGCSNENEMSSPEGTVKGYLKDEKHCRGRAGKYLHPTTRVYYKNMNVFHIHRARKRIEGSDFAIFHVDISDVKTTLVSKKEGTVMLDDKKWHIVKNENATVEVSYKLNGENFQQTVKLVLLANKWYITSWK
ncbi:MAG: hypothetical protein V3V70_00405 [Candidatus Scalindua sp.]